MSSLVGFCPLACRNRRAGSCHVRVSSVMRTSILVSVVVALHRAPVYLTLLWVRALGAQAIC